MTAHSDSDRSGSACPQPQTERGPRLKLREVIPTAVLLILPLAASSCDDPDPVFGPEGPTESGDELASPAVSPTQDSEIEKDNIVPGKYIIRFNNQVAGIPDQVEGLTRKTPAQVRHVFTDGVIRGFSVAIPDSSNALEAWRSHPLVRKIYPVRRANTSSIQEDPPSWGLNRIDQPDLPLNDFYVSPNDASSVDLYMIDSGIRTSHNEFGTRAAWVPGGDNGNFVDGDGQSNGDDCTGRGTQTAGVAGGSEYGVAKGVNIWGLRVVDCSEQSLSDDYVAAAQWISNNVSPPAVVNASLNYGPDSAVIAETEGLVNQGITVVAAAGNEAADACNASPGGASGVITVGATNPNDDEWSLSNYGSCVDMLAPGSDINAPGHDSNDDIDFGLNGTSYASPHVAGVAAMYLEKNSGASPSQVRNELVNDAILNTINLKSASEAAGTPNRLLNVTEGAPHASFTVDCTGSHLTCSLDAFQSSDSDGSIQSYDWSFGDNSTGSGVTTSHTYSSGGEYTVQLTVTDDASLQSQTSKPVEAPVVTTVELNPDTAYIETGTSESVTAMAKDQHGNALSNETATWSTVNSSIATISSTGDLSADLTAQADGSTTYSATVEGVSGSGPVYTYTRSPITVSISGPTFIDDSGYYTWSVSPSGGAEPYSYTWDYCGSPCSYGVSSTDTYTRYVNLGDPTFKLYAHVDDSEDHSNSDGIEVYVQQDDGGGGPGPLGRDTTAVSDTTKR